MAELIEQFFDDIKDDPKMKRYYQYQGLMLDVTESLAREIEHRRATIEGVAERLGWPVEKLQLMLDGSIVLDLQDVASICWAIGLKVHVSFTELTEREK